MALPSLVLAAMLAFSPSASAQDGGQAGGQVSTGPDNVAIKGYDPVAYFTEGRAVKGSEGIEHSWNNARWRFASEANRDMFAADPERYGPQFGGFCAWGMSQGMVVEADPEAWTIVDGKLYLKMNHFARGEWRKDPAGNIAKAQRTWDALEKPG